MPSKLARVTRAHTIQLSAPPRDVFTLFEPIGEKQWAADWDPHMIYPESGDTLDGAVFTTEHASGSKTIWTIVAYDPNTFRICYVRTTADSSLDRIEIRCEDDHAGATRAHITYTLTALSERGNDHLRQFTDVYFQEWMGHWEQAINYFLSKGQALRHH